jgi:hypothetical protein
LPSRTNGLSIFLLGFGLVKSCHALLPLEAEDIGDHIVSIGTGEYKIWHLIMG